MNRKKYLKKYHKIYAKENKARLNGYIKYYQKEHKESLKLYNAEYYQKNKDKYKEKYLEQKEQKKIRKMMDDCYRNNLTHVDIMREKKREAGRRYKKKRRV